MTQVQTLTVAADEADLRLDRWFKRHFPELGHGRLEKLLRTGQVRVDGKRARGQRPARGRPGRARAAAGARTPRLRGAGARPPSTERDAADLRAAGAPPRRRRRSRSTSRRASPCRAAPDRPPPRRHARRAALRRGGAAAAGPPARQGHQRRAAAGPQRRAAARLRRRRSASAPRASSIGRWWSACRSSPHGRIDLALAKLPGRGGERMHADDEEGQPRRHRLPGARACRQAGGLARAAAADRAHPPAARPLRGDRHADPGRRQIWRQGRLPARRAAAPQLHLHARAIALPDGGRGCS